VDYVGAPIKTAKDVKVHTNLPVLGSIPRVKGKSDKPYLVGLPQNSYISEAYRTLRTNIAFANPDSPADAIAVTSAMPKEGKSTVASNLAIVMAQLGKKVLLVDADLRKPSIAEMFDMEENKGLSDILAKETEIAATIRSSEVENLSLISAGRIPPNPAELLESRQMDNLIKTLKKEFDFVVFDTPPAGGVTDAIILARKLKGALIVVQANKTSKIVLSHTKESFEQANARILGVVLNKVLSSYAPYGYLHHHPYGRSPEKSAKEHVLS
jgi:capsular exopolysaccharide synthesis family protein